jgi:hypothetical protein
MASLFKGRSETEWRQILDELKAERLGVIRGDRFVQVSTSGKSYTRRVRDMDTIRVDEAEALQALSTLNPTVYGTQTQIVKAYYGGYTLK